MTDNQELDSLWIAFDDCQDVDPEDFYDEDPYDGVLYG